MVKRFYIFALALSLCVAINARAESLLTLGNYAPSLISSEDRALSLYQMLPTNSFKGQSGCFQRAHYWSYLLSEHYAVKSMKLFLFFTARYQREFDYQWAYHVAPLIPTQMKDGSIQELVFDPTFTQAPTLAPSTVISRFDNKPIPIREWLRYFIYPNTECKVIENYQEFLDYQDREYCYLMKAPMYNYIPNNFLYDSNETENWFDASTKTRINWRPKDLDQMMNALRHQVNDSN